jgi:hypothetical protein
MKAAVDNRQADAFSSVIRRYSASVQMPWAINSVRRHIVSQDAIASRLTVFGTSWRVLRVRVLTVVIASVAVSRFPSLSSTPRHPD